MLRGEFAWCRDIIVVCELCLAVDTAVEPVNNVWNLHGTSSAVKMIVNLSVCQMNCFVELWGSSNDDVVVHMNENEILLDFYVSLSVKICIFAW